LEWGNNRQDVVAETNQVRGESNNEEEAGAGEESH